MDRGDRGDGVELPGGDMTEFLGWIGCAGRRVLVERVGEDEAFHVVRLCEPAETLGVGRELRVPKRCFEPCAPARTWDPQAGAA